MTYLSDVPGKDRLQHRIEHDFAESMHVAAHRIRLRETARLLRDQDAAFAAWARGCGVIRHNDTTQMQVHALAETLQRRGVVRTREDVFDILRAADHIASAAMWLVVHMTYARKVYLDGRALDAAEFKVDPEGHTGGALNMVPAYVGYLAINAATGITRAWLMGQGHCVAAIDAINVLVGNMLPAHAARYDCSDAGLTRLVQDFYRYEVGADGAPVSPLGSHVNQHTAGGILEGGYLGFAELQYVHMPLPGERLVAFLSDGAFEEQRGGDWAARWWRAEDSGIVTPIMIANGRRIDQRTTTAQEGGVDWLREHLKLNSFSPLTIDGRDPASFACCIFEMEEEMTAASEALKRGHLRYPAPLHFGIAETIKGWGFPGAGTNRAHNLPLSGNPHEDPAARNEFNAGAQALHVPASALQAAAQRLNNHAQQKRPRERDHALARRRLATPQLPAPPWQTAESWASPMDGIDAYFSAIVQMNPKLRVRLGNPDELRSNRMNQTLDVLKHRVTSPEPDIAESVQGSVITALNEEAVANAALANKGGINLIVSYEAFAMKMLGGIRQEIIFARHQRESGNAPGWLGIPLIATSHTWENGKNEQSHQDPSLPECLLGEMSDVARVVFPADWNSAIASLRATYSSHGQIWAQVIPKRKLPTIFSATQAESLVRDGAIVVRSHGATPRVLLMAVGAYQLLQMLRASERLAAADIAHRVVYIYEPGRFRNARDRCEAEAVVDEAARAELFPAAANTRVLLTHTRPELMLGVLRPLDTGRDTRALGYINHGGTLDLNGMLFANRSTWAHVLATLDLLGDARHPLLTPEEQAAVGGRGDPKVLFESA